MLFRSVDKLSHILYAFAKNQEDGSVVLTDKWSDQDIHYPGDSWESPGDDLFGNFKQLNLLKQQNRNLKVLLSIGGWTFSNEQKLFDAPASTPEGRKMFAQSSVQILKDYGLDGIDIDWEYPQNPGQGEYLILLLQEIRNELDAYAETLSPHCGKKPHFELTIASSANKNIYDNYHLDRLSPLVDFINLMVCSLPNMFISRMSINILCRPMILPDPGIRSLVTRPIFIHPRRSRSQRPSALMLPSKATSKPVHLLIRLFSVCHSTGAHSSTTVG